MQDGKYAMDEDTLESALGNYDGIKVVNVIDWLLG